MQIELEEVRSRAGLLIAASAILTIAAFFRFVPPIAQDQAYHFFGDDRAFLGITNFWNVASNLLFAVVGCLGLWKLRGAFDRVLFSCLPISGHSLKHVFAAMATCFIYRWRLAAITEPALR